MRVVYAIPGHIELYVSVPHGESMIGPLSLRYCSSKAQESPVPLIDLSSDTMLECEETQEYTISRNRLAMIVGKDGGGNDA